MKTSFAALIAAAGLLCACDRAQQSDAARQFQKYKAEAERGDAKAQFNLGVSYRDGAGVEKNLTEAAKWWSKAAEQGDAEAQRNLGSCYYYGEGVEKNYAEAVKWLRKAAEQGNAEAQRNLGNRYYHGEGVEKDYSEAVKWYRKATEQNLVMAQFQLGLCYDFGEGLEKNSAEAVKWYRKAAEQNLAVAQRNLGYCYRDGEGVEKDDAEAMKWFRKAAEQGETDAQVALASLQKKALDEATLVERKKQEEQAKAAEQARADKEAQQARLAEEAKRAEEKRMAAEKEKKFADWKAKRKAEIQEAALTLTPAQMTLRNKAVASWNKLTPDQREKLWREEYQRLQAARKNESTLVERRLAQMKEEEKNYPTYYWDPAVEAAYAARQAADLRARSALMSQQPDAAAQAAAAETARQQAAAQTPAPTQARTAPAVPVANLEQQSEVDLINTDGIFTLPVRLNGVVTKTFVLDTGASAVSISREVYRALVQNQTIDASDERGSINVTQADGTTRLKSLVRLRSVVFGDVSCKDVVATVGDEGDPLLLGGSALRQFKSNTIDNQRNKLILRY
jgi:clan AA aspartic protease (TIGR02281 family)